MRRLLVCLLSTCLMFSAAAFAYTKPPFPRLAVNWIGNQKYQDPAVQKQLARGSVVIINTWPGWDKYAGTTLEQVIKNVKAINPNALVFEYINNNEIDGTPTTDPSRIALFNKLASMHWYLYPSGTSGTPVPSSWPGATRINNTLFTAKDSNGDDWVDWYAKWAVKEYYVPNPSLDGFFLDNVFWKPRVVGDWNLDGVADSPNNPTVQQWLREGDREHFEMMHKLMPGKFQIGNLGTWGQPDAVLTEYQDLLNGGIIEGLIGYSWSVETWGGWQEMMAWYRKAMGALAEPKLGIFAQVGNPTDYQAFRYGFASCLMDNGYYAFNSSASYGDAPWFDEYAVKLGYALTPPPTAPWQHGVYRRDFQNGIALVNPKGNGPQTVTLETDYKRIAGTQDPSVNNGQTVRTLTLKDRDGIILMRIPTTTQPTTTTSTSPTSTQASATPAPPPQVTVQ